MDNALGEPQTIVLLGGTSDIGRAIVARLVSPATTAVVLAARRPDAIVTAELARPGLNVDVVAFDAADTASHGALIDGIVARHGDLDVVIVAFGVLGDQAGLDDDPEAVAAVAQVNFTGALSVVTAVAARFRSQGHGRLVVLSSVAGERVRKSNYVYGATKAGLDGFAKRPRRRARRHRRLGAGGAPGVRALEDDHGARAGAVRHHTRSRRRGDRTGAAGGTPHGVGAGHPAPAVQRPAPPPGPALAPPPTLIGAPAGERSARQSALGNPCRVRCVEHACGNARQRLSPRSTRQR